MKRLLLVAASVLALAPVGRLAAQQQPATDSAASHAARAARARRDRTLLTREDLDATEAGNLYEVVARLRPLWLRDRYVAQVPVIVVVDGVDRGYVDELRGMHSSEVESIQYLDQFAIRARLGKPHNPNGAIVVVTRKI